jgi:saxitoxin biosynthesis operon SxtJ-like protein
MDRLRKFGLTLGAIFSTLALLFFWRHRLHAPFYVSAVAGPLLLAAAVVAPRALAPVERAWSALATVLGFVNTRLLLAVVYFLVFAPIALVLRIAGKDLLERRRDPRRPTYWRTRDPAEPDRLTRPY